MNALRAIIGEIVHLFVDDGAFALALVLCSAAVGIALRLTPDFAPASGIVLFVGCAGILLWNVARAARAKR
jgi:hypothetical protein